MNARRGMILLEVLISIMISSMIFMALMGAVFQLSKARITVDNAIDIHTSVSTIVSLMEQDFSGATIPVQAELPADKEQSKTAQVQPKEESKKEPAAKEEKTEQSSEQGAEKKEKQKPIKNIFYATVKDANSNMVSCITNNPTAIYWSERAGKAKPRIVRIVYTLVPDPEHKESFVLKRQEGTELDLDAYKNPEGSTVRAYEIAAGIKSFKITYLYLEKKEETPAAPTPNKEKQEPSKETTAKKEPPAKPDYKSKHEWAIGQEKENSQPTKTKEPLMPSHMNVSLIMFSSTYKQEYPFEFVITLPANEEQQIKQAKMRYQETAQKTAGPQKPTQPTTTQQEQSASQNESGNEEISVELVALNVKIEEKMPENAPSESVTPHDIVAENNVQKSVEQFYHQMLHEKNEQEEKIEGSEQQTDQLNNDESVEQIDMPEGRIDIIQDGDTTHIVYQGPIAITPEILQGIS